jgi:hypothetical protein
MAYNVQESPQFAMLSPEDQERILADSASSGIGSPMMKFAPSAFNQLKEPVNTSIFASDRAPEPARGALSVAAPVAPAPVDLSYDSGPAPVGRGALSALPQQRQPFNLQAMIDQFAPKDDSASKYFAIAAALGKPTGFGTMGEKFANVAQALNDQKANQEKLRSQYVPIIMQQVAAQQARDEQAAYKAEAAMQAQQAAAQMQKERLAASQQAQQERLAQQAQLAQQHEALLRTLAGNKPEPAPQIIDRHNGVFTLGRDGKLTQLTDPVTGKPLSGKDGQLGGEGTPAGTAPVLGVPTPRVLPWANQSNPKDADKVKAQEIARGLKMIELDNDAARQEASTAQQAQQFVALNQKVDTGGIVDKTPGGPWIKSFGDDYATMQSISSEIVPKMRPVGSGTSSDLDIKMFSRATIGVDKPKQTNENIAAALTQRAKNSRDYADFRSTYLEQNGTLQGADQHWNKYLEDNPIFDHASTKSFSLNPKRVAWTQYFGGNKAAAPVDTPFKDPNSGWDEPAGGGWAIRPKR